MNYTYRQEIFNYILKAYIIIYFKSIKMPISKSKYWKTQKEKEPIDKYSNTKINFPKYYNKRETSVNTKHGKH